MKKEIQNLYVFGYGLGLLIPFLIFMHTLKHALEMSQFVWVLLIGFVLVMTLAVQAAKFKPILNAWILIVIALSFVDTLHYGYKGLPFVFLGIAFIITTATILNVQYLKPLYDKWMIVAGFIGATITAVILTAFYYVVFGIAGIVMRLMGKDLLDIKPTPEKSSYWIRRDPKDFDHKHFENQF